MGRRDARQHQHHRQSGAFVGDRIVERRLRRLLDGLRPCRGDGNGSSIKFQRYDAAGVKVGGDTTANFTAAGDQFSRDIVATDDGGFVIVWGDSDSSEYRRFNAGWRSMPRTGC
jgi:hypothetical protein